MESSKKKMNPRERTCVICLQVLIITFLIVFIILLFNPDLSINKGFQNPVTTRVYDGWRSAPKLLTSCGAGTQINRTILSFGFSSVSPNGLCQVLLVKSTKKYTIKCPFNLEGLNFITNGTNFNTCDPTSMIFKSKKKKIKVLLVNPLKTNPDCKTPEGKKVIDPSIVKTLQAILKETFRLGIHIRFGEQNHTTVMNVKSGVDYKLTTFALYNKLGLCASNATI